MDLLVVAGLGNPGPSYTGTRHNIGFDVVDALARRLKVELAPHKRFEADVAQLSRAGKTLLLVKPRTYMNESGRSLAAVARFYKLPATSFVVAYDEYQIPLGQVKLAQRGSDGGHNGIRSILSHLRSDFVRFRLGIAPLEPRRADMKDFVLGKFTPDEQSIVNNMLETFVDGLLLVVDRGAVHAMNQLNQRNHERNGATSL